MSEPMAEWAAAFVAAQSEMPDIPKSKTATIPTKSGGSFKYSYADLPDIIEKVRPVLAKHGLAIGQSVEPVNGGIGLLTRIFHKAGHVETFGPVVLPGGGDARAAGSAITYARRYGLCAALNIAADEDDDASVSVGSAPAEPKAKASRPEVSAPTNSWAEEETEGSAASGSRPSSSSGWKDLRQRYGKSVVLKYAREMAVELKEGYVPSRDSDLENLSDKVFEATAIILAEKQPGHSAA